MESEMYGTPVVGADIGGIPELIKVGETGELFESGNIEELKDTIRALYNNKTKTDKYAINCKNIEFDNVDEYCKKLVKYYQ